MFDSLNDEIKKSEGPEKPTARLILYAGVLAASIFGFWALYAGILFWNRRSGVRKDLSWKSKRFSATSSHWRH
jgi:hypothetical protein